MKKTTLGIIGLSASLFAAGVLFAQTGATKATPAAEKPQRLVQVSTLKSIEANREFQSNVQVLQTQRQAAVELNGAMEKEKDAAKKKELKAQVDALIVRLNENNDKMRKAYGFSLDRNYTLVIETAHVYMLVTEEEAAKIEKAQSAEQAKSGKK